VTEVVWAGKSGDVVETVVAVMLACRHPRAVRIRPSQGDGGIDVKIPNGSGWDIYQIKRFATNLEDGQKTQIKNSFQRLRDYAVANGLNVTSWSLVMPLDPTNPNHMVWFAEMTEGVGYRCDWLGAIFVNGLASDYPNVIEYYFGTGQQRVQDTIRQVANMGNLLRDARTATEDSPIQPLEVESGLRDLFAILNKFDPHYAYGFAVTPNMPAPIEDDGLVIQYSKGREGCFLTISVYAKHPPMTDDEAPTISVLFGADPGTAEAQAIEDFVRFGAPLVVSGDTVARFQAHLPGGLSADTRGGTFFIAPTREQAQMPDRLVRLQVLDPADEVIAETIVRQRPATYGFDGQGVRCEQVDKGGVFTLVVRFDVTTQTQTWNFQVHNVDHKPPFEVLPGLRVMTAFRPPNSFRLAEQYGPADGDVVPIPESFEPAGTDGSLMLAEAVHIIQQHTTTQLTMPTVDDDSFSDLQELFLVAALLQGHEPVQGLTNMSATMAELADDVNEGGPQNISVQQPMIVRIGDAKIRLGNRRMFAAQVNVSIDRSPAGSPRMTLTPHNGREFFVKFALEPTTPTAMHDEPTV
jgi:hypothetical protein